MTWQYDLKACGLVTGAHTAATTSITVGTGEGTRFAVSPRKLVIFESSYYDNPADAVAMGKGEVVVQTLQASDVLTVIRGQDGTTAIDMSDTDLVWYICNFVDSKMGSDLLNVRAFGAVGDGIVDDSAAVHLAFQSAVDGGSVWFPAGDYSLATWPDAGRDYGKKLTILGEGTFSIIDGPGTALFIDVSDQLYAHGLNFTNWLKVFEFDPITTTINSVCIEYCYFRDTNRPLSWSVPVSTGEVDNFSVLNCTFTDSTERAIFMYGFWRKMTVDGCLIDTCVDGAIQLGQNVAADETDWRNTTVSNNSVRAVTTTGSFLRAIQIYGKDAVVSGNTIETMSGATTTTEAILCHTQRGKVTNNSISNIDGSAGGSGYAISIQGDDLAAAESSSVDGYNVIVDGNMIDMSDTAKSRGIILGNDNIVCSNNVVLGVRDNGISSDTQTSRTQSNITISCNRIDFGTVNTASGFGVLFQTSGSGHHVIGNNITGAHRGMQFAGSAGTPTDFSVIGNNIGAALVGLRFNPSVTMTGVRIQNNNFHGMTTGVSFEGTAVDLVQLVYNTFRSVTTDVSTSTTPTNFIRVEQNAGVLEMRQELDIITGGLTVTAGGATITAGGLTVVASGASVTGGVTAVTGGLTATAGGLTVTAGGADIQSGTLTLEAGNIIHNASGAPAGGLGADGDIYLRTDGGSGTTFYVKESGSWVAK